MDGSELRGSRVLVTGGSGFLGRVLCKQLEEFEPVAICAPRSSEYDLRDRDAIRDCLAECKPNVVIHLAAVVGGIGANMQRPGAFFYENAVMGIELMEQSRQRGVEKFVTVGSICAYPKFAPVPFREDDLWNGYPEETNAPYGIAKKALIVQGQAYRKQYGFRAISLLPVNMYGPDDNFDLQTSHVIPALIRKICEAQAEGRSELPVWGTGKVSREFLFVRDAARGILLAADRYDADEPVNLGTGQEITIADLVTLLSELCGFTGSIRYESDKPDGQPRRCLDTSRAKAAFGFEAEVSLREGLRETIEWYRADIDRQRSAA